MNYGFRNGICSDVRRTVNDEFACTGNSAHTARWQENRASDVMLQLSAHRLKRRRQDYQPQCK